MYIKFFVKNLSLYCSETSVSHPMFWKNMLRNIVQITEQDRTYFFLLKKMIQSNYIFIIIYSFMIYYLYIRLYEVHGISIVTTEMQILLL